VSGTEAALSMLMQALGPNLQTLVLNDLVRIERRLLIVENELRKLTGSQPVRHDQAPAPRKPGGPQAYHAEQSERR
jgi:hypothetical protein